MQSTRPERLHHDLGAVLALTKLLERLDLGASERAAAQYRQVASTLGALLDAAEPGPALDALLDAHPVAAELYENLHYAQAGLCRHALGASLASEQAAVAAIRRAAQLRM